MKPKKGKSVTVSTFSPSVCHEVMGPDAMILVFWMLRLFGTFLWLLPPVEVLTVFILSFSWSLSVSLWVLVWSPYQRDYLCLFCKVFLMRFYLFNNLKHTPLSPCFAWLSVFVSVYQMKPLSLPVLKARPCVDDVWGLEVPCLQVTGAKRHPSCELCEITICGGPLLLCKQGR